ncbi:hypothetical protein QUF80_12255 [Desulfococcaceae bacterium HSG8]|nr:hypothetical protein [Desulfococcaceae bacterium HSG8]
MPNCKFGTPLFVSFTHHVSRITFHVSRITFHASRFIFPSWQLP